MGFLRSNLQLIIKKRHSQQFLFFNFEFAKKYSVGCPSARFEAAIVHFQLNSLHLRFNSITFLFHFLTFHFPSTARSTSLYIINFFNLLKRWWSSIHFSISQFSFPIMPFHTNSHSIPFSNSGSFSNAMWNPLSVQ